MKLTISERSCLKYNLTLPETLFALAVKNCKNTKQSLCGMLKKGIFVKEKDVYVLSQQWSEILDLILAESPKTSEKPNDVLLELAGKMQKLYPKGKMLDKFGRITPYYYRNNKAEVAKKLQKFFEVFGKIPHEDILDATKRYVDSFNGNYSGMRLLKYFILKDDIKPGEEGDHVEQISDLATFLENKDAGESRQDSSDFTMQII